MGSKSKMNLMKSYKDIKKEAAPKKNAQDIISKSLQKNETKTVRMVRIALLTCLSADRSLNIYQALEKKRP